MVHSKAIQSVCLSVCLCVSLSLSLSLSLCVCVRTRKYFSANYIIVRLLVMQNKYQ